MQGPRTRGLREPAGRGTGVSDGVTSAPRMPARAAALLLAGLSLSGCASAVASVGLGSGAPSGQARAVQIFVDSTRPLKADGAADGTAHFSLATVSVPPGHRAGGLETASFGAPDRASDFAVVGRRALDAEAFRDAVATHLSGRIGSNRDVLVFVHGFNTGFDEARYRLAQIVTDGGFNGVPVLFTWPSKGSLFGYGSDREAATASRDAMERLLLDLAALPDVGRVHVLAHSMGSWLAMEALREVAIAGHPDLDGHLGEIILAAPDIDQGVFRQQVERLGPGARVSVFAATNDRALGLSGFLAERPRLGAIDSGEPGGPRGAGGAGRPRHRPHARQRGHDRPRHLCQRARGDPRHRRRDRRAARGRPKPAGRAGRRADAPQFGPGPAPVVATPLPVPQAPAIAVP